MQLMNKALRDNTAPLATHYGAIYCLGEFGMEVVIQFVVPYVKPVADRIQRLLESSTLVNGPDKTDAEHVKQILLKVSMCGQLEEVYGGCVCPCWEMGGVCLCLGSGWGGGVSVLVEADGEGVCLCW